jgi:cytochrome c2
MKIFLIIIIATMYHTAFGAQPDWTENASVLPGESRGNIYGVSAEELSLIRDRGFIHAMKYPVNVTGLLVPYQPLKTFFNTDSKNPLKLFILNISKGFTGFRNEKELYEWLGLNKFNAETETGIYKMPRPFGQSENLYVGAGLIKNADGEGLTFSCFACHSASLFGKTVMGLTNKRPHSNKFFHMATQTIPKISPTLFQLGTKATAGETRMYKRTKDNLASVDGVVPQVLGLDTSLPHVALSLAKRNDDAYATKNPNLERYPKENELSDFIADSKPMPWWNLKYKTRWLSDGSIVSGNPIFTNFLWNEIGRGTDLKELEQWMKDNQKTIEEITAAAFATEAPLYTDFFPPGMVSLERAKKGEKLFNESCMKCHGQYEKAWSSSEAATLLRVDILKTTKVIYHEKTPVKDVGTDPQRYQAMKYFAESLNNLAISKWMQTKVEPQVGYVPPPLVGIWARYPYFHNNSIPNLCALLSVEADRPKIFYQGPAVNRALDYDHECVGYPVGDNIPNEWLKDSESKMDTRRPGLRNIGHTKMLLDENGKEKFSSEDKKDLIAFLKTL